MKEKDLLALAEEYENRGDDENAYKYLLEAAHDENNGEAAYSLADHYYRQVEVDYVQELYDRAAHYCEVA